MKNITEITAPQARVLEIAVSADGVVKVWPSGISLQAVKACVRRQWLNRVVMTPFKVEWHLTDAGRSAANGRESD